MIERGRDRGRGPRMIWARPAGDGEKRGGNLISHCNLGQPHRLFYSLPETLHPKGSKPQTRVA